MGDKPSNTFGGGKRLALVAGLLMSAPSAEAAEQPTGIDLSSSQVEVDWAAVAGAGHSFAYVKATEGNRSRSPTFVEQYDSAYYAGLIRGAYHFARPDLSGGAAQADFFVDNGGDWSADGQTLPGVLDLEYNPNGSTCYDLSSADMVGWIHDFADEYRARTGREAVFYTTADWWNSCTAGSAEFGDKNPLWIADYGAGIPALPTGWDGYTLWQLSSTAPVAGILGSVDMSVFNGDAARLLAFANNTP